jgi:SAM-dependent methyltransferase
MQQFFDQLLSAYWLRPETALWRAIDIRAMVPFNFEAPSLDMGCGDGVFSFIRSGGRFSPEFDVFESVTSLDRYFEKVDVFDSFDGFRTPNIIAPPSYRISVGFDHKPNLLKKAAALGLYESLAEGDGNRALPFETASFASVFSNVVYWLDEPAHAMAEISRILKRGGRCCLMLPNRTLRDFSFYYRYCVRTGNQKLAFLEQLDRGRMTENVRHAKTAGEWTTIFESAGLAVELHRGHLSRTVVQIWDIGLRPLFPILKKLTDRLTDRDRAAIKSEWISVFRHFLGPFVDLDSTLDSADEPAFHCFILRKQG